MIQPGATIGVLGGGQLGRMFAIRARVSGYRVIVLEPDPRSPAGSVADHQIEAAYDDEDALGLLADECAAVTTEFENVPAASLELLAERIVVRPAARAVEVAQDRIREKTFLRDAGFPTAPFRPVCSGEEAARAAAELGQQGLLKTSRLGYDGKGQAPIDDPAAATAAFERFGGVPCVLEARLALEAELSVVLARGADGTIVSFPPALNRHENGILDTSLVPCGLPDAIVLRATTLAGEVARSLDYVGVLGVELFVANGGELYVNEIAPRPHNSGHFTLDACSTDQFELQLRALCGLPLVMPRLLSPVAMANLLGDLWAAGPPRWNAALAIPGVRLHLYGKSSARPGRKMGHLNCTAPTADEALRNVLAARAALVARPD